MNLYPLMQQPIMLGMHGGSTARYLEKLSDEEILHKTMQNFRMIYGYNIPEPESFFNTRWSMDPFSYGSYSYMPCVALITLDEQLITNH